MAQAAAAPVRRIWVPSTTLMGTLMAGVLMLCVTWAVISGDWIDGTGGLFGVAAIGVIEAALLAWGRLHRISAIALALPLAFAAVYPFTKAGLPSPNMTWHLVVVTYASSMWFPQSLFSTDPWQFVVGLATVIWLAAYTVGWFCVREKQGQRAVLVALAILGVNVLNAPDTTHLLLPTTVAAGVGLLVIAQTNFGALRETWDRRRLVSVGVPARFVTTVVPLVIAVVVASLLLPPLTTSDYTQQLASGLRTIGGGIINGKIGGSSGGNGGGRIAAQVGFSAVTDPAGPLRTDQSLPMLRYTTDAPAPVYLTLSASSDFRNGQWWPITSEAVPGGAVQRDPAATVNQQQLVHTTVTVLSPTAAPDNLDTIGSALAPWIGDVVTVGAQGSAVGHSQPPSQFLFAIDRFVLSRPFTAGSTIGVTSAVSTASADQLRTAPTEYPPVISDYYTQLDDPNGVLHGIARQMVGSARTPDNEYDIALAIQNALRDPAQFTYTLSPPPVPAGQSPVLFFLTESKRGYCQYFASSMGALLRAEGIPARVVNGYGPGHLDSTSAAGATYTVSSNDAHSWVEAYFPTYGWIPFEPTPPSTLGNYQPLPRGAAGAQPSAAPTASAHPTPKPSAPPRKSQAEPNSTTPAPINGPHAPAALVAWVVLLLILMAACVSALFWLLRPRDLRGLWRRVAVLGRLLGERRRESDTDWGYARRVIAALPADTTTLLHRHGDAQVGPRPLRATVSDALTEMASLSGQATFSPRGIDAKQRVRWLRSWQRVVRHLPRLWWRSVLARRDAGSVVAD